MNRSCNQFLWTERYRPNKVEDAILPERIKQPFLNFIKQGNIPNLLLTGSPGTGKTTTALAALSEIGADVMEINGSLNASKGTLRNEIAEFSSAVSFTGGRKYVLIDEADWLDANHVQPGLRAFMEKHAQNCGFVFTANMPARIMDAIRSRCVSIDFKVLNSDKKELAAKFHARCCEILDLENVKYEKAAVAEIIKRYIPDWRQCLNQLQHLAANGKITKELVATLIDAKIEALMANMKGKDFTAIRKWLNDNPDFEQTELFNTLYRTFPEYLTPVSDCMSIVTLGRYQDMGKNCANPRINMLACLAEIMVEAEWKE